MKNVAQGIHEPSRGLIELFEVSSMNLDEIDFAVKYASRPKRGKSIKCREIMSPKELVPNFNAGSGPVLNGVSNDSHGIIGLYGKQRGGGPKPFLISCNKRLNFSVWSLQKQSINKKASLKAISRPS